MAFIDLHAVTPQAAGTITNTTIVTAAMLTSTTVVQTRSARRQAVIDRSLSSEIFEQTRGITPLDALVNGSAGKAS
jgi:hypothetical protein